MVVIEAVLFGIGFDVNPGFDVIACDIEKITVNQAEPGGWIVDLPPDLLVLKGEGDRPVPELRFRGPGEIVCTFRCHMAECEHNGIRKPNAE